MHTNQKAIEHLALLEGLEALEAERTRISSEGEVLFDCWLAPSKPGGTARTSKPHWQLRSRKAQFGGKKSKYIKTSEVGQYKAAIDRGRQLKELERQISLLRKQMDKVEAAIVETRSGVMSF